MRIIIDTEKEVIIVPDTYYQQIDRKNSVLEKAGVEKEKRIDYVQFIKDSFDTAITKSIIRKADLKRM